jgi:hypothetical protein
VEVTGCNAAREERISLEDSKKFEDVELEAQLSCTVLPQLNVPVN